MASASSGRPTANSTGRVLVRPSVARAAPRPMPKVVHTSQSGRKASTVSSSMKVAKASFSQIPFHHFMVTRSPNHMWAVSWATTWATRSSSSREAAGWSTSSAVSR